jgi:hypothetical protein
VTNDDEPNRHAGWRRRLSWLGIALAVPLAWGAILIGFAMLAGWLLVPDWSWVSESKRPLEFPRDTAKAEEIVTWVHENGDCRDMYVELPREFAAFTAGGLTSCWRETVFLPQWSGIPDDAGGYWYSPNESPQGWDMWGMICENPVDLGDGWWKCGMGD